MNDLHSRRSELLYHADKSARFALELLPEMAGCDCNRQSVTATATAQPLQRDEKFRFGIYAT